MRPLQELNLPSPQPRQHQWGMGRTKQLQIWEVVSQCRNDAPLPRRVKMGIDFVYDQDTTFFSKVLWVIVIFCQAYEEAIEPLHERLGPLTENIQG